MSGISKYSRQLLLSLIAVIFFIFFFMPAPQGLEPCGQKALAIFILCSLLWVTNALPLMITSLLAIILVPITGVLDSKATYALFGNQAVFFILGAFILASALMRSGLSTRLALMFLKRFGHTPRTLMFSTLFLPAFFSFWMSEHAVAAMMFPIVVEITEALKLVPSNSNYGKSLFLSMSWGCIIGGVATFLGGARVPLALGILQETTGQTVGFTPWAMAAMPTVVFTLGICYVILTRLFPPELNDVSPAKHFVQQKVKAMGPVSRREWALGSLMVITILCWIFIGQQAGLATIALAAVILAFVLNLLSWKEVEEDVNWGVFLMYGGAICLGYAVEKSGAAQWMANKAIGLGLTSKWGLILCMSFISIFLTELMSNSAVIAMLLPMTITLAPRFGVDYRIVTMALTIPAGLAFTLPMGTPAMAIAFSSGFLRPKDSLVGGVMLEIFAWAILNLSIWLIWPLIGFKV